MTVGAGRHYSKLPTLPAGTFRYEIREKLNEYNGIIAYFAKLLVSYEPWWQL